MKILKSNLFFLVSLSLLVALPIVCTSCSSKLEEEVVLTWPDKSPQKVNVYAKVDGKRMKVKEIKYYENGNKEMEGEFIDGRKEGVWTSWFENGQKQSEGSFREDLRDGKATVYRENGAKFYEGYYSMGRLHGKWIFYDIQGNRAKEVQYEHGEKINELNYSEEGK